MKRCVTVFLCLLVAPVGAEARPIEPGTTAAKAVTVAVNYWAARGVTAPAPQCAGKIAWDIDTLAVQTNGTRIGGYLITDDNGCRITLTDTEPRMLCTSAVHEYGHALGLDHNDGGVMSGYQTEPVRECKRAFRRKKGQRVRGRKARTIHAVRGTTK